MFSSSSVDWVSEAWMISFLDTIALSKNSLADVVEVLDLRWEPWHLWRSYLGHAIANQPQLLERLLDVRIADLSLNVNKELSLPAIVLDELGWPGDDSRHIDIVIGQDVQSFVQDSLRLRDGELETHSICYLPVFLVYAVDDVLVCRSGRLLSTHG